MAEDAAKTVIQARISGHLDYCNSLLLHIANNLLQRLQSIQNVTVTARHVTSRQFSVWLHVRQRIKFKLAVFVHKVLHGQYLCDDCQLVSELHSEDLLTCTVQTTRTWLGDSSFSATGPHFWNSLSVTLLNNSISLTLFKRHLKTRWLG